MKQSMQIFIYESVRCEQINGDYFVHIYEGEDHPPQKKIPLPLTVGVPAAKAVTTISSG